MTMTLTPILIAPKGLRKPIRAAYEVFAAFCDARETYFEQTGATFVLGGVVSFILTETWEQICARRAPAEINGGNIWRDAFQEALDRDLLGADPLAIDRGYYIVYLRPPAPRQYLDGFGGMMGLEDWRPLASDGALQPRPGMACVADEKAWFICGVRKPAGYDVPWWAGTRTSAVGALVHEIGHLCRAALPDCDQNTDTPMFEWWMGPKRWGSSLFTDPEKAALTASGDFA